MDEGRIHFRERAAEAQRLARPSYPAYLWASLRATSLWQLFQRGMRLLRRFRLFSTILRWSAVVIGWLEASAIFLLTATLLLAVGLPLLGAAVLMLGIGCAGHRRCNARLASALRGRRVYVCFAARGAFDYGRYFGGMTAALAAQSDAVVLIVSPYFWRSDGRPYLTMRRAGAGVYLIRRHYWFSLFRRVLSDMRDKLTLIY